MKKKDSLKGFHGVYVVVEDLGPEMRGVLTRQQVKANVESRLRTAGIRLLEAKEAAKTRGEPYLYINVAALPIGAKRYACRIDVEFHQLVNLTRNASRGHAITWDEGVVTVGGINTIRDQVDDLIFEFIYDYLATNPDNS